MKATCPSPPFSLVAESPYRIGSRTLHGVDWILSDGTGHLFIESKTKRLTVNARTLWDAAELDNDLAVMASAITQHYRNTYDALAGKTAWLPDGLPVFPLILTLENWYFLSPPVQEKLNGHVRRLIGENGIAERMLEQMPYTIASVEEFEIASQIIAKVGINAVMARKVSGGHWGWSLLPFLRTEFPKEMDSVTWRLFGDDWSALIPDHRP